MNSPNKPAGESAHPFISGYEILDKLGEGAVGAVYKARQSSVGRIVALKVLLARYARDEAFIERFYREARAAGNLNHMNIVQGIDAGCTPDGRCYFAMEYVEGETIKQVLRRDGRIPEAKAVEITLQIAHALRYASRIRLVHRDIKPENIMLTKDGTAKLTDLGLAKSSVEDAAVTQAGQAMGTPMYISPEQARGQDDLDVRTDIYSLGATLYHMLTGAPPFAGENPTVILLKHINETPPSPREMAPEISEKVCRIVAKMMAKKREDRYQTATQLIEDLQAICKRHPSQITYTDDELEEVAPARKRSLFYPLLVAGVLLLAGAFAYQQLSNRTRPDDLQQTSEEDMASDTTEDTAPSSGEDGAAESSSEEKQVLKAFELAQAAEEAGRLQEAFEKYWQVAAEFPESSVSVEAADRSAAIGRRLAQAEQLAHAEKFFNELVDDLEMLTGQSDYGKAIETLVQFNTAAIHPALIDRTAELLDRLRNEAHEIAAGVRTEAENHLAREEFDEARKSYRRLTSLGIELYDRWAREGEAAVKAAELHAVEQALEAHRLFWIAFAGTLREDGAVEAKAFAGEAINDLPPRARIEAEWDIQLLDHLRRLDTDALAALKSLEGSEFELLGKTPVLIKSVTDAGFVIERAGVELPLRTFDSLSHDQKLLLAQHHWNATGRRGDSVMLAYLVCVAFHLVAARDALDDVQLPEPDVQRFARRIEQLSTEAEAQILYDAVAAAARSSKWRDVIRAWRTFAADYAGTWVFGRRSQQTEEWYEQAIDRLANDVIIKMFKGNVRQMRDGSWRFAWDFSSPAQLEDFHPGEPPSVFRDQAKPPKVIPGALVLQGIDAIASPVFKGAPLTIEYRIMLSEERAPSGYGGVSIASHEPHEGLFEFALCHGNKQRNEPDMLRNQFSIGRTAADCWKRPNPKVTYARREWHHARCDIRAHAAIAFFNGVPEYNSNLVKLPSGADDPNAMPELEKPFRVQFSSWMPQDVWLFKDITIAGHLDPDWVRAQVLANVE